MTRMDSSVFQDPTKFDPTRIDDQPSIPPYCFIAFGAGVRKCPGYEFAKIEALVTIHCLVTIRMEVVLPRQSVQSKPKRQYQLKDFLFN